ncbi:hypothetical protein ACQKQA_12615 [Pseudomonas sp. NPDC089530]|uniref:hypothetical protein n=1 Tax=Pseudomonas sp. NPDC089530 TaxID=3390651 RepID=UPI003CFEAA66
MQLIYPKAPANGAQVLRPALQAALQSKGFGVNRQFAQATAAKVSLSEPYRGYSLSLDDLAQGKGLKQATLGDWHYLVFSDGVSIADAQLAQVGGQVEFASLNHGALAAATVNALNLAENTPHLQGRTYELRLLFVSALHVAAIWLHASDEDVLIPIEPTPKHLASTKLYSEAALLALLAPAAQRVKTTFDADTTGQLGG